MAAGGRTHLTSSKGTSDPEQGDLTAWAPPRSTRTGWVASWRALFHKHKRLTKTGWHSVYVPAVLLSTMKCAGTNATVDAHVFCAQKQES